MMPQAYIERRGAREHNMKQVAVGISHRTITLCTGVFGPGKSSIVVDTIAAEARYQLNETVSTFVRTVLPRYASTRPCLPVLGTMAS